MIEDFQHVKICESLELRKSYTLNNISGINYRTTNDPVNFKTSYYTLKLYIL